MVWVMRLGMVRRVRVWLRVLPLLRLLMGLGVGMLYLLRMGVLGMLRLLRMLSLLGMGMGMLRLLRMLALLWMLSLLRMLSLLWMGMGVRSLLLVRSNNCCGARCCC